jgi:EAL and modified HD-GYP domain-containing signal transduction protein
MNSQSSYCIALQPICDAKLSYVADELLYRNTPSVRGTHFDCGITPIVI